MFGNGILRILAVVVLLGLIAVLGVSVYNAGVSAGLAEAARAAVAAGEEAPVIVGPHIGPYGGYGYGPGWGFGFFGILFWILGFFLILALIRAAFGWGRWGGRGPDGHGRWDERRQRLEELHRDLHREDPAAESSTGRSVS